MLNCKKSITIAALTCITFSCALANLSQKNQFNDLRREPDAITVITENETNDLKFASGNSWTNGDIVVTAVTYSGGLKVQLKAPTSAVKWLQIHWNASLPLGWKYLGDAWERAYGDLEWKPLDPMRIMPWYFLASNGKITHGYGVKTGPSALCYWTADKIGITIHADVRCGGMGVELGQRTLRVCTVVCRCGRLGETPFDAARAFCGEMCSDSRMPKEPVYGFNDWYCSYGHDTAAAFLTNAAYIVGLSPKSNRPFAVVDDGWQWKGDNGESPGLWNETNPNFSKTLTMKALAKDIRNLGARPGLWYRPLIANTGDPQSWRLQRDPGILDPTVPAVREHIKQTVARFHCWGYDFIKHDYTTYDLCGRWGMQMDGEMTSDGWSFADRSKTTAEVIHDLYQDIRDAAGNDSIILGCNTVGQISAGIFEMQRIGDDTSGQEWNRTRKMGVNCMAFRAPQNGTFFCIDGDCAGQVSSNSVSWDKNSKWLYLLSHSGTSLFVSFPRETVSLEQEHALRGALEAASQPQPLAEPLDWQARRTPVHWVLDRKNIDFAW